MDIFDPFYVDSKKVKYFFQCEKSKVNEHTVTSLYLFLIKTYFNLRQVLYVHVFLHVFQQG